MRPDSKAARLILSSATLVGQSKRVASNGGMDTIGEVRLANLELLISFAGTLEAVAAKAESTSVYLSQIRNRSQDSKTKRPREMGSAMARRLEKAFGLRAGWMDRENLAGHDYTLVGGRVVLPSAPATQTPGRSDRWRPSLADDNMSEQHPAEKLSDALGTALLGLPTALRPRSVDACRKLAESPDSGLARIELWDVLQHSPALKPAQGTVGVRAQNIDRAFREAFYDVLDNFKTTDGRKLINDLRDAIEHKVADALRLDIDQARRALNARQSEQG